MRKGEDDIRLVYLGAVFQLVGNPRVAYYQKTGKVVLVGFDAFLKNLHVVHLGCILGTDSRMSFQLFVVNVLGTSGSIIRFYHFQFRMMLEKFAALCQCYRMRIDFFQVIPDFVGQALDAVADAQLVFSDNGCPAFAQQFVVMKQASGYRIFYGNEPDDIAVLAQVLEYLLECIATDQFDFLILEVFMGCNVVI